MSKSIKFFILFCLSLNLIITTGCGSDDEEETTNCTNFPTTNGTVDIDGESLWLFVAQLSIQAGGSTFGDSYFFQIAGVSSDCNSSKTVNFTLTRPSGESASGTYTIKDFFDAGEDDAYGSFISQTFDSSGQSLKDLISGTVVIVDEGNSKFDISLNAQIAGGGSVNLDFNHQF